MRIFVYQMGKVGSTSITNTLSTLSGVEAYQTHFLGDEILQPILQRTLQLDMPDTLFEHAIAQLAINARYTRMIKKHLLPEGNATQPLHFISLTRDPLDWYRSFVVQSIEGYIDSFRLFLGKAPTAELTQSDFDDVAAILKANIVDGITFCGGLDNPNFRIEFRGPYLKRLLEAHPETGRMRFHHLQNFLRPMQFYELEHMVDLSLETFDMGDDHFGVKTFDWGKIILFRYEELETGFQKTLATVGLPDTPLQHLNISEKKQYSTEIKQSFKGWREDADLRRVTQSPYTRIMGY
jgi:hypothetical protein